MPESEIPTFENVSFPFKNTFDSTKSLPLMACATIDIDNDGIDEVFVSGGVTQQDAIFKFRNNEFIDITKSLDFPLKPNETTTLGASSFDINGDGVNRFIIDRRLWIKMVKEYRKGI